MQNTDQLLISSCVASNMQTLLLTFIAAGARAPNYIFNTSTSLFFGMNDLTKMNRLIFNVCVKGKLVIPSNSSLLLRLFEVLLKKLNIFRQI